MGSITLPDLPESMTHARAQAIVAYVATNSPHRHAYAHARGKDWGVTISSPTETERDLYKVYDPLLYLELI